MARKKNGIPINIPMKGSRTTTSMRKVPKNPRAQTTR